MERNIQIISITKIFIRKLNCLIALKSRVKSVVRTWHPIKFQQKKFLTENWQGTFEYSILLKIILFVLILLFMCSRFTIKYRYQPSLDYQKIKRQLFRIKNQKYPPIPKTIEAMHEALEKPEISQTFRLTLDKDNNLYVGSVVKKNHSFIVFASHRIIEMTREFITPQSRKYLIDGTFRIAPRSFYQLIVISIEYKNDVSVSIIKVVSENKILVAIIFFSFRYFLSCTCCPQERAKLVIKAFSRI